MIADLYISWNNIVYTQRQRYLM